MPAANTVAQLAVVITADTTQAETGLASLGQKVGSAGSMLTTAFTGAAVAGIAAVGAGLAASVVSAADFEKTMSGVKAVSGATATEMDALSAKALQLGKDTSFSASEAAAGMEELVKGGLSIPDIMNGAAEATLNLAAAGGVSLPDAATIAANALAQFNLKGEDMAHVADLIAGAANASALDVSDFKFSLTSAGAVAATVGFSFDDLAVAIAEMGKAGITGSDAGTSLKTMFLNLQPSTNKQIDLFRDLGITTFNAQKGMEAFRQLGLDPARGAMEDAEEQLKQVVTGWDGVKKMTGDQEKAWVSAADKLGIYNNAFFDATGSVKSMADVAQVLQDSLAGMTDAQRLATLETIFGSDAIRAGAVLAKEGAAGFNDMAAAMGKVSAETVGKEKLNNLAGSVEQLKGSLETMGIMIGIELLPVLKDFVDAITQAANDAMPAMQAAAQQLAATLKDWAPTLKAVAAFLWDHRDAILAVVVALGTFVILSTVIGWMLAIATAISTVTAAISGAGGAIAALGAIVAILGGPVTLIIVAISAAIALLAYAWMNNWGDIQGKTAAVVEFLSGVPEMVSGFFTEIGRAAEGLQLAVSDAWQAIKDDTMTVWNGITQFLTDWWREILVALTGPIGLVAVLIIDNWDTIKTTTDTIFRAIANLLIAIWDEIYGQVIQPKLAAISTFVATTWETIRAAVEEKITAVQTLLATTWDAIATKTTETLNTFLAFVRDTVFEPLRAAIAEKITAVQTAVTAAWQAIADKAHEILDPILTYIRDTIFTPIKTAVETAMTAVSAAFETSVNAVKTTVDTVLGGIKSVWETTWTAIQTAAQSPAAAMTELITLVGKLKDIMPEWLIPHSPTPFQIGLEGIMKAAQDANSKVSGFLAGTGKVPGALDDWLNAAIGVSGVGSDWLDGLRWLAMHESTGNPKAVNPFDVNNVLNGPGPHAMGLMQTIPSTFRAYRNKDLPDDIFDPIANAVASISYIQDRYGSIQNVISGWARRGGYESGGWAGLRGPELAWLGEGGPEYVVPNSALRSGAGNGGHQTLTLNVAIGGRVAEQIVVEGYELAASRGRLPSISRGRLPA